MPSIHIPPEIFLLICAEVEEPPTLAALCRTSPIFRDEAQRVLYRTIDLEGRDIRSFWSWAHAVTQNPHLAGRVHALSLQLPEDRKLAPADVTKIQRALHACVNLKELKLSCNEANGSESLHGWMLDGAPFRLTKFANTYFSSVYLEKSFWNTQSEIRALSLPRMHPSMTPAMFDAGRLPNLIAFGALPWQALPPGRPLQRLETSFSRDVPPLAQYSRTLTTLNLVRESLDNDVTLFRTITNIVGLLPALLHFGIAELVRRAGVRLVERSPATLLQGFSRLETFFLFFRNEIRFFRPHSNLIYEMDYDKDVEDLAVSIMESASPTLRRVVVGSEAQVDEVGREFTCTVTRDGDGEIHKSHAKKIDFDAVSMFWK
ncbi:hypothetical protein MSAN_00082700 [Mycena sanguinolenta]|uniref:F-box domain-containing protein n=1 Tax=Mycena sanguinolenta TaxID=230812 RepID=A0A8H7DII1_9AGAR|nr:hypothetical protein MSAN_00082700 [Mycena sanguinolenta]